MPAPSTLPTHLTGISSMATRQVLAELAGAWQAHSGVVLAVESVGGVDAARRVMDGEAFDLVILASDALQRLSAAGRVVAGSEVELVRSPVAVAVRAGAPLPDLGSEAALRAAVMAARSVGVSTGPSGTQLMRLFERWGLGDALQGRLRQPPPGTPVGQWVASGEVELGFQQLSELMHLPGIQLAGGLPPGCEIVTTFSAGLCAGSSQATAVREMLAFMASPQTADIKRRHGMAPA